MSTGNNQQQVNETKPPATASTSGWAHELVPLGEVTGTQVPELQAGTRMK